MSAKKNRGVPRFESGGLQTPSGFHEVRAEIAKRLKPWTPLDVTEAGGISPSFLIALGLGSLDFCFLENKGDFHEPPKSSTSCRGVNSNQALPSMLGCRGGTFLPFAIRHHSPHVKFVGVDSPLFLTIVLSKHQPFSLGVRRFSRKKDFWV